MYCTHLSKYFAQKGHAPEFQWPSTDLWKGYVGSWEIIDERLYLVSLSGKLKDGTDASLATIFPDTAYRVLAHWFTGEVLLSQGWKLGYAHRNYGCAFKRDIFLYFVNGQVDVTCFSAFT